MRSRLATPSSVSGETQAQRGWRLTQLLGKSVPGQGKPHPAAKAGGRVHPGWRRELTHVSVVGGAVGTGSSDPWVVCRISLLSTPGAPSNFPDLPLVTKMCYRGCPDINTLGLGPYVSIVCCQASLCNRD